MHESEPVAQRRGQGSCLCRRTYQGEAGQIELHRACRGSLTDDQVQLEVLHRRVQGLLDRSRQAMNLVDKEDVMLLEVRQDRRKIARVRQDQAGRRTERPSHFTRNDVGNGRLSKAGWTVKYRMVERFTALFGRLDADPQGIFHARLPDVLVKRLRTKRLLHAAFIVRQLRIDYSLGHDGSLFSVIRHGLSEGGMYLGGGGNAPCPGTGM